MKYIFNCPKCSYEQEIIMPMKDYTSEGHYCEVCGTELIRDPSQFCKSYKTDCDGFFGKSYNHH